MYFKQSLPPDLTIFLESRSNIHPLIWSACALALLNYVFRFVNSVFERKKNILRFCGFLLGNAVNFAKFISNVIRLNGIPLCTWDHETSFKFSHRLNCRSKLFFKYVLIPSFFFFYSSLCLDKSHYICHVIPTNFPFLSILQLFFYFFFFLNHMKKPLILHRFIVNDGTLFCFK